MKNCANSDQDAIEGILDSLQLNIDDGFSITMPSIPATSLKDLVQQNLTEHHADENSISSSIKKTSHASFNSNTIAQNIVQSVQVVVDQIAKGTWGMFVGLLFLTSFYIGLCHYYELCYF